MAQGLFLGAVLGRPPQKVRIRRNFFWCQREVVTRTPPLFNISLV